MTLTWANLLSALRIALIPLFILALIDDRLSLALALFALAGITDLLDGMVARSYQQTSKLGAYLDPAADKLLLTAAFLMLSLPLASLPRLIPFFVFLVVVTRDLIIVIGALVIYRRIRYSRFAPLRLSKWTTAVQIIAVFLVLIAALVRDLWPAWAVATDPLATASIVGVLALTVASGVEYAYRFIYRFSDLEPGAR